MSDKDELLEKAKRILEEYQEGATALKDGKKGVYNCSYCGGVVLTNGIYCPHCGKKLDWSYARDNISYGKELIYGGNKYYINDICVSFESCGQNELKIIATG